MQRFAERRLYVQEPSCRASQNVSRARSVHSRRWGVYAGILRKSRGLSVRGCPRSFHNAIDASREEIVNPLAKAVRETKATALKRIGQLFVIDPEQVHDLV